MILNIILDLIEKIRKILFGNTYENFYYESDSDKSDYEFEIPKLKEIPHKYEDYDDTSNYYDYNLPTDKLNEYYKEVDTSEFYVKSVEDPEIHLYLYNKYSGPKLFEKTTSTDPDKIISDKIFVEYNKAIYVIKDKRYRLYLKSLFK